ncbi:electron transfer flavoprotein subunit beta [Salipaludibacillus keqinensis]|jgi:electron transfer flavoprotein beta subunit|uniref:Electron transfer flavoprotein subunit beta n=1 Tax=Salipaludibacillus keqinensis TaxID=2045207 RepID=A0A323TE83_9BACI|nr:electron transfer flavoprotein subunit beta/FixA family protein [Salipaludibacillus keqinensis]PYZ93692.1 electron transfer flavoprotein subunit beta [Salipaludibacillus keqinensis]
MNIYVIMKRTFDTEEKIQIENGEVVEDGAEFIINPYDEYAIEEAIKLRDEHGGEVTIVSVGDEETEKQIRTGLAMGADKAVLIEDEDVEHGDPYSTEQILAAYFKDKEVDIILGGNIAVDGGSGQVGPRLAEQLGFNHVTSIVKIDIEDGKANIERDVEGDQEILEVPLPLLVTAQQGLNEPRYPSLPGIMKAKKKPLETLDLDDLDLEEDDVEGKTKTVEKYLPPEKAAGKILEGETEEQVTELVSLLKNEAKVI